MPTCTAHGCTRPARWEIICQGDPVDCTPVYACDEHCPSPQELAAYGDYRLMVENRKEE